MYTSVTPPIAEISTRSVLFHFCGKYGNNTGCAGFVEEAALLMDINSGGSVTLIALLQDSSLTGFLAIMIGYILLYSKPIRKEAVPLKKLCCLLVTMCVMLLPLSGCGDDGSGRSFRFPLESVPQQLDPQVSTDPASITLLSVLFEGLTGLDAEGNAIPAAAEWAVSADGRTYTFTLRESYWSTIRMRGEETPWDEPTLITAQDFVFGIQRAVSPSAPDDLASALYSIQNAKAVHEEKMGIGKLGVRADGEDRLIITLNTADPTFPATLATTPCMPCDREFFEYTGGRYGLEKQYLLTNGPFLLTAWNHGESLLLNKNEGYHAADAVSPTAVRFVIRPEEPVASLMEGTMDAVALTESEAAELVDTDVQTVALQDTVRSVYFNVRHKTLANVDIRRALRDSVEWSTVYSYLEGAGESVATGYVAPDATVEGEVYRAPHNGTRFVTDVTAAQIALGKGLRTLEPENDSPAAPAFTVLAAEDEHSANVARYLIQSWQKNLKVYCTLETVSPDTLAARVKNGSYDIAVYTVTASGFTGAENLAAYTSTAADNYTGYRNAAYDLACNTALKGGRKELAALETMLRKDCPTLPLSFPRRYYGVAANTADIVIRPFGGGSYGSPFSFLQAKKWDE